MTKFQKTAIAFGVIYLVVALAQAVLSLCKIGADASFSFWLIKEISGFVVSWFLPLILILSVSQNKNGASITAAILGGVSLLVMICKDVLQVIANYYFRFGEGGVEPEIWRTLWSISGGLYFVVAVLLCVSVGCFAASNRQNKFVLIASILFIVTKVILCLYSLSLSLWIWEYFYEELSNHLEIFNICNYLIHFIPGTLTTCLLYASAATVRKK